MVIQGRDVWKAEPTGREAELVEVEPEFQGSEARAPKEVELVAWRRGLSQGGEARFGEAEPVLQGGGASCGEAGAEAVPGQAAQASLAPC